MSDTAFKLYYDHELAHQLAERIRDVYPEFESKKFITDIDAEVNDLEFKDRIRLFSRSLRERLPADFPTAWSILEQTLGDRLSNDGGIFNEGFALWPFAQFIEDYGLDHFEVSMHAMREITQRHTAEFAIRPFLTRYPEQTLGILHSWADDPNPHVRRLVSEGTRTRLPWGPRLQQFIKDPSPTLELIEKLKDDPSEYVRRSVANHLNDIGKDHPEVLLSTARRWMQDADKNRTWIIRRALRSLVKAGNTDALGILGYGEPAVELEALNVATPEVLLGQPLSFSFDLTSTAAEAQRLLIDYIVHFVKKNGQTSPKVFKLTTRSIDPQERVHIERNHPIRPITTRVYYSGRHLLEIQVNGWVLGRTSFELDTGDGDA